MTAPHLNGTSPDGHQAVRAMSWREERRLDRLAAAESARQDRRAGHETRIGAEEARARLKREGRQARSARRSLGRRRRADRRAAAAAWLTSHVTDLLFAPVIGVPAALAWTGMAAYGAQLYGPAGLALPAFSEGAMWAFAASTTIQLNRTAKDGIERPVWHLRTGTAVFAAVGAVLNFLHGLSPALGHLAGPVTGTVMALVSVAGVAAHQLITAGPRQSRAGRQRRRAERSAERRQRAIRRAALRRAVAVLDGDGNARLRIRPGAVAVCRRLGRIRLEPVPHPAVCLPWPMVLPGTAEPDASLVADVQAGHAMAAYLGWHSQFIAAPSRPAWTRPRPRPAAVRAVPAGRPEPAPASRLQVVPEPTRQAGLAPASARPAKPAPERAARPASGRSAAAAQAGPARISDADLKALIQAEVQADPDVSLGAVAKKLKRGRDRVRPLLEEVRREAAQPHERLEAP